MNPDVNEIRSAISVLERADFKTIQQLGYHFQRNDFYSPLNDCAFLEANRDLWAAPVEPADIEWNIDYQMKVAGEVARFVGELRAIPAESAQSGEFHWNNGFWSNADALVHYGLLRSRQPRQIVEIGCGWSSCLAAMALAQNRGTCAVTQIEPYPRAEAFAGLPAEWVHHQTFLQRASLDIFEGLSRGDLLFYDGSHCAKVASDVNWFFFRVLPVVKPGVLIHIHDILLPYEYPEQWIFERGQTWNEQYVVQAFLMNNHRYRILIANRYLWHHRGKQLDELYQGVQPSYGSSLWIEKL